MNGSEDNIPISITSMHCREMWRIKNQFDNVKFQHIRRERNTTAHDIARVRMKKIVTNKTLEGQMGH